MIVYLLIEYDRDRESRDAVLGVYDAQWKAEEVKTEMERRNADRVERQDIEYRIDQEKIQ